MLQRYSLHTALLCLQLHQVASFVPFLAPRFVRSASTSSALQDNATPGSASSAINWIKDQKFDSLLPKDDALAICNELLSDKSLIDDSEALVEQNWEKIEDRIRNENRSTKDILGEETTERLLKSVENIDVYDNDAVRAFLGSDAVNNLFAKVLCKSKTLFVVLLL